MDCSTTSRGTAVVRPTVPDIVIMDFDSSDDNGTMCKTGVLSSEQKMPCPEEDNDGSGPPTITSSCLFCPVHCSTIKNTNQLPKQNGLYGKIAELMSEIQQKRKSYLTDKAALVKRIEELEGLLSTAKDRNSTLVSQNHLLENKVKSLQKWVSSTNKTTKNDSKWFSKEFNQDVVPKRSSLRRTKSQEIVGFRQGSLAGGQSTGVNNSGQEWKTLTLRGLFMQSDASISSSRLNLMAPIQEADEDSCWAKEKELLLLQTRQIYSAQIRDLDKQNRRLLADLKDAQEQVELLEFRLLELEEHCTTTKVIDVKQFDDQCVGTNDSPTLVIYPEEYPEEKGNLWEFRDEKIHQIKGKILEIVRLYPVTAIDKTTLVQAVAILELCHKLITNYKSERPVFNNQVALAPDILGKMENVQSHFMTVERSQLLSPDVLLPSETFSDPVITNAAEKGQQSSSWSRGRFGSETLGTEGVRNEVRVDESLSDPDAGSLTISSASVKCSSLVSIVGESVKNVGSAFSFEQCQRLVNVVNPIKPVVSDDAAAGGGLKQSWSNEAGDHSLESGAARCDPSVVTSSVFCGKNDQSVMQAELKRLEELLQQAYCEMRSKDAEYCIKVEALKCDKEDCVGLLEQKLSGLQDRELKARADCESLSCEKMALEERLRDQGLKFEWHKEELLRKLEECQREVEKLRGRRKSAAEAEAASASMVGREMDLANKLEEAKLAVASHKETIARLKSCLSAAVAEVDTALACCGRIVQSAVGTTDEERLLAAVKELAIMESEARQRLGRLEKKEAAYRETLDEADRIMADVERNYQERLDEMEQSEQQLRKRIQYLEQSERRLNDMLKESSARRHPEVRKVGELLERLMEVEASELLLRERLIESGRREEEAEGRLAAAEEARKTAERQLEEQEDVLRNLENLQRNERTLLNRIAELEISESALQETLRNADNILNARESKFVHTIEKLRAEVDAYKRNRSEPTTSEPNTGRGRVTTKPSDVAGMIEELQQLNDREADLESLKGSLSIILASVSVCPRCHPLCTPTLNHLESQVQQLHEIVFGNRSSVIDPYCNGSFLQPAESQSQRTAENVFSNYSSLGTLSMDGEEDVFGDGDFQTEVCPEVRQSVTGDPCHTKNCNLDTNDAMIPPSTNQYEEENSRKNAELSNLALQISHLQEENEELKRSVWRSESALQVAVNKGSKLSEEMEAMQKRNGDLASKVNFLNRQLRHLEDTQQEKDRLQQLLSSLEVEMQKKKEEEHRLCAENLHLRHKVEGLRERLGSLQMLKKDHKALLNKCTTLEKKVRSAESSFAPIQQQNSNLLRECWEKDQIIEKLRQELNCLSRSSERHSCFCSLRPLKTHSVSQSSDDSGIRDCSGSCSLESEILEDCVLDSSSCGHASEDSRPCSPASSTHHSSYCHSTAGNGRLSPLDQMPPKKSVRPSTKESASRIPRYTALNKQGTAHIKAESATSKRVVNGKPSTRTGPLANDPVSHSSVKKVVQVIRRQRLSSADTVNTSSSSAILKCKVSAEKPPVIPIRPGSRAKSSSAKPVLMKTASSMQPAVPDAPTNFRVTRRVGHDGLVVAWNTPVMDSTGCSNGCTVSGYQIFVSGALHQNVRSAHRTKALLNNLDLANGLPMEISIQALSLTGQSSKLETTYYDGNDEHFPLPDKTTTRCSWENADRKYSRSEALKDAHGSDKGKFVELKTLQGYFSPLGKLVEV